MTGSGVEGREISEHLLTDFRLNMEVMCIMSLLGPAVTFPQLLWSEKKFHDLNSISFSGRQAKHSKMVPNMVKIKLKRSSY